MIPCLSKYRKKKVKNLKITGNKTVKGKTFKKDKTLEE